MGMWGQTGTSQTAFYGFETGDASWTAINFVTNNTAITAHGGSKYGATDSSTTASLQYNAKVASPQSLTCYYSKTTTNTNAGSHFEIQVSSNNATWTTVTTGLGMNDVTKGEWYELTADLSSYSNVFVRVYYDGTSAVRALDDITLVYSDSGVAPAENYDVDFESATTAYDSWTFDNMTSQQTGTITAHGGTYYGTTGGKESASITTSSKVANPGTLTCYVSKQSTNNTSSTWYIQVSSNGTSWTNVESRSATDMTKGEWKEFTANLSSYSNVYVRVYYSGSTAIRNIDDLTLTTAEPSSAVATTTTINVPDNFNTDIYTSTTAGTLTATVKDNENNAISGASVTWESSNTDVATIDANGAVTLVAVGTTTITANYAGVENEYRPSEGTYTLEVTSSAPVLDYAVLPFNWAGGPKAILTALDGVSGVGLGTDYASTNAPYYVKFDSSNDYILVKTDSQPGVVTIGVKMIGGGETSTITVQGSSNGVTFDEGEGLVISGSQDDVVNLTSTRSFDADVRYVKLVFTKGSNVGVGPIAIYKGSLDITGYGEENGNWYLIASPYTVAPAEVTNFITSTYTGYDLYRFDENVDKEWVSYKGDATTNNLGGFDLVPGQGYLYARNNDVKISFSGTEYGGNGTFDLSFTSEAEFEGWNLVGNPYRIDASVDKDYYKMSEDGELIATGHANAVAPMQGIFVQATQAGQSVTFTKVFPPATNSKEASVSLNLSRNRGNVIDRAIVRFGEGSQLHKFQLRENSTKVYFTEGNQDFAVVRSQKAQGEMPVNFKAEENGTYTLSVNTEEMELNYLHLIDNMTGMDIDLLQTPSYTFDATTNDYASRFRLVFSANNVDGPSTGSEAFAFYSNGNWVVGNEGEATLQVIDVNGRIVSNETINGTVATSINATPGVYMFRLVNGNEVKTQKIVVK